MLFQIVFGFLRRLAIHQRPGDGLVGPHACEHAPGGQGQLFSGPDFLRQLGIQVLEGQVKAGRYGVAPLALLFKIRAGKGGGECPGGGAAAIAQLRRDAALRRRFRGGKAAPVFFPRLDRPVHWLFQGEEVHQALLDDVALVVAVKFQLHISLAPAVPSAYRG